VTRSGLLCLGAIVALGLAWSAYRVFGPSPSERLADLIQAERWVDAEALARDALADAAEHERADLQRGLGIALGRQREHIEAIEAYRAAYALRPEDADLRHRVAIEMVGVGRQHDERGETDNALARYREAVTTAPEIPHGHRALVTALHALGRTDDTIAALQAALAAGSHDVQHRVQLAWLLATHPDPAKRDAEAAAELAQEVLIHDRTPETLDTYAVALGALGHYAEAIRFELDAIELAGGKEGPDFERYRTRLKAFVEKRPYVDSASPQR